jgi:hypothetical protein
MTQLKKILAALVVALLLGLGLLTLLLPQRTFSPNENRLLTQHPSLTLSGLLSGTVQDTVTNSLSDQFPLRDQLMAAGTALKLLCGRTDIGNTYIGAHGTLFEKVTDNDIDLNLYAKNLSRIDQLAQNHPEVTVTTLLVPTSGAILPELLPEHAMLYDSAKLSALAQTSLPHCNVVDPTQALRAVGADAYYKTDHHWTTLGALAGYQAWQQDAAVDFSLTTVSTTFLGSLYSRVLLPDPVTDTIQVAEVSPDLSVTADGQSISLYDWAKLEEKDQYQLFFGGNHGITEITGGSGTGTLLVLKDSFANCMVPFLTAHYQRILMIDLRYYAGSVNALLEAESIDDVLVLYEQTNFAGDRDLAKLALH